jgi:hypothetical protein
MPTDLRMDSVAAMAELQAEQVQWLSKLAALRDGRADPLPAADGPALLH